MVASTARTTQPQGTESGTMLQASSTGSSHRCFLVDQQVPNLTGCTSHSCLPPGQIELRGGPTELGGPVAEGNVFLDGNPVGRTLMF